MTATTPNEQPEVRRDRRNAAIKLELPPLTRGQAHDGKKNKIGKIVGLTIPLSFRKSGGITTAFTLNVVVDSVQDGKTTTKVIRKYVVTVRGKDGTVAITSADKPLIAVPPDFALNLTPSDSAEASIQEDDDASENGESCVEPK